MIFGEVLPSRAAIVKCAIVSPDGAETEIAATLDTGFTDYLTLPASEIVRIRLPCRNDMLSTMADGRKIMTSTHAATLRWNDEQRPILVLSMEAPPLIGMALLHGHHLGMDVIDGGRVTITPLR